MNDLTLNQRVLRRVVRKLALKKPPETVPRSGLAAEDVDCYVVQFLQGDEPWLLVEAASQDGFSAKEWDGQKYADAKDHSWNEISSSQLYVTHFFGRNDIKMHGLVDYLKVGWSNFYRVLIWLNRSSQFVYNNRGLTRFDRYHVLRKLFEDELDVAGGVGVHKLVQDLHSKMVWGRPDVARITRFYRQILGSLVASGDLSVDAQGIYRITKQAPSTLSEFELEERRHNDSAKTARRIMWLTVVIAIAAVAQAYLASKAGA